MNAHILIGQISDGYEWIETWTVGVFLTAGDAEAQEAVCVAYAATWPGLAATGGLPAWVAACPCDPGMQLLEDPPSYPPTYRVVVAPLLGDSPLTAVLALLDTPPVAWADAVSAMNDDPRRQALAHAAETLAVHAARLAAYLEGRRYYRPDAGDGDHPGHVHAVRKQNRVARALRKALGFTQPDQPLTF